MKAMLAFRDFALCPCYELVFFLQEYAGFSKNVNDMSWKTAEDRNEKDQASFLSGMIK